MPFVHLHGKIAHLAGTFGHTCFGQQIGAAGLDRVPLTCLFIGGEGATESESINPHLALHSLTGQRHPIKALRPASRAAGVWKVQSFVARDAAKVRI